MSAFWVIFGREVHSRWTLLATSLALGALVSAVPYLTTEGTARQIEVRSAAALGIALVWSMLLAIGLGATCLVKDLTDQRIAFDFRLPVPELAIWAARVCGALVVVLVAGVALILLPALAGIDLAAAAAGLDLFVTATGFRAATGPMRIGGLALWAPLLFGALLFVSNLLGLAVSGRRRWFALDFASTVIVGVVVSRSVDWLRYWGAAEVPSLVAFGSASAIGLALAGAAITQVVIGRTEVDRAHRSFSVPLASVCAFVAASSGAYAAWYGSPQLHDLDLRSCQVAPVGERLVSVIGHAWGREESQFRFLLDPVKGFWRRTGPVTGIWPAALEPQASEDGETVAWLESGKAPEAPNPVEPSGSWRSAGAPPRSPALETTLRVTPVGAALAGDSVLSLTWRHPPVAWALSPDGAFVASRQADSAGVDDRVLLEEIATGRLLRSIRMPGRCEPGRMAFVDDHRLRVACGEDFPGNDLLSSSLLEVDTATAEVRPTGMQAWRGHPVDWQLQELRGHGRIVRIVPGDVPGARAALALTDAASGARVALVQPPPGAQEGFSPSNGRIFHHGGFGLFDYHLGRRFLALYDERGRFLAGVEFGRGSRVEIVAEAADGRSALVAIQDNPFNWGGRPCDSRAVLLDTRSGAQEVLAEELEFPTVASIRSTTVVARTCDATPLWFDTAAARLIPVLPGVESGAGTRSTGQVSRSLNNH